MRRTLLSVVFIFSVAALWAQVPRQVITEHFTNTLCSICASKNPGFYQNLANHPDILHIAYHPSAPYSSCFLHNHNPSENDGRTNFYGIYGSTPRWVIQGEVQPSSADEDEPSFFAPYTGDESPISIFITEIRFGTDSVRAEISIRSVAEPGADQAALFVAYVEDTVFYSAPNGEEMHFDVFRKAFTPVEGSTVSLPSAGDSVLYTFSIGTDDEWITERMYVIAILQDGDTKEVLQSGSTDLLESQTFIQDPAASPDQVSFFPNPATSFIKLKNVSGEVYIMDLAGRILITSEGGTGNTDRTIDVSTLPPGNYIIRASAGYGHLSVIR